jgi:NarL family two-component system sensor histidine kinase LiaS
MSILQRQIVMGISFSLIATTLVSAIYLYLFPPAQWTDLLEEKLFDLPIIFLIPGVSFALGIAYGLMSGLYWRNALRELTFTLQQLELGQSVTDAREPIPEMETIYRRVHNIQQYIQEQTKRTQKLVNTRAEEEEKRMKEVVSQERNRLARELHDSVSQQLFAASMLMSAIIETRAAKDGPEEKQLRMVENMIHQSQLEMRALLLHLRPVALKGKSLQQGIEELLQELAQKVPLTISWKAEEIALDKGVEDHLFRILQESVSNTLRHAKASTLEVLLIQRDHLIILRVIDDGIGFDVEKHKTGSYGIQNMYERALEIGGKLKLVSVKNQGTRLEVKVPIVTERDDET